MLQQVAYMYMHEAFLWDQDCRAIYIIEHIWSLDLSQCELLIMNCFWICGI